MRCQAEIKNAEAYLAECEQMEREAVSSGDWLLHIKLGFLRVEASERAKFLKREQLRSRLNTRAGACDEVPAT